MAQYCPSEAADDADSKCDLVQLNGNTQSINNNTSFSGCETYSDFTSQAIADLNTGQSYSINIMQGTCQDDYDRFCNAWIDFNGDGDFNEIDERSTTYLDLIEKHTALDFHILDVGFSYSILLLHHHNQLEPMQLQLLKIGYTV